MKKYLKLLVALSIAFVAMSCVKENNGFDSNVDPIGGTTGVVTFGKMDLVVMPEPEVIPATTRLATRADIATDDFIVEIFDADKSLVKKSLYKDIKSTEITLPVGKYTLAVRSGDIAPMEWERPVYATEKRFDVTKAATTEIGSVICTLANIKTTVAYTADLSNLIGDQTVTTLSVGDARAEFSKGETRAAYFKASATTLNLELVGTFEGKPVNMNKSIANIKPGQWRKITIAYEYASQGNVNFVVKVETFTYDEEVVVDIYQLNKVGEETIPDEDDMAKPSTQWQGRDINAPFTFAASMFDNDGNCTEPMIFETAAKNGVESFVVKIESSNSNFLNSFGGQLPAQFDLCTTSSYVVKLLGFKTGNEVKGKTAVQMNLAQFAKALYEHDGQYKITLTVKDAKGLVGESLLNWTVNKANASSGPQIAWLGHDMDTRYEVNDKLECKIEVTAQSGVKEFKVTIDSNVLDKNTLESVGLSQNLDLVNPGAFNEPLTNLGFPTGDKVKNQKMVAFDISQFMPLIGMLNSTGYYNFVLTVTDNDGVTAEKSIKLSSTKK